MPSIPPVCACVHLVYTAKHHPITLKSTQVLYKCTSQLSRATRGIANRTRRVRASCGGSLTLRASHPRTQRAVNATIEPKSTRRLEGHRAHGPVRYREQQPVRGVRERATHDGAAAHLGALHPANLDSVLPGRFDKLAQHASATSRLCLSIQHRSRRLRVNGTSSFRVQDAGRELTFFFGKGDQSIIKAIQKRRSIPP